eukprot:9987299-Alexandrium_andersonii.AAC.1
MRLHGARVALAQVKSHRQSSCLPSKALRPNAEGVQESLCLHSEVAQQSATKLLNDSGEVLAAHALGRLLG